MRTFHIGGTASGIAEQSSFIAKHNGIVQLRDMRTVKNRDGQVIVMSRKAQLLLLFLLMDVNCNDMMLNMVQFFLLKMVRS